jgi:thioredoxin 1
MSFSLNDGQLGPAAPPTAAAVPLSPSGNAVTDPALPSAPTQDAAYRTRMTTGGPLRLGPKAFAMTSGGFDQSVAASPVTVVMFGATWCSSCKLQAPDLAWQRAVSGFPLGAVDVDNNPDLANRFGISSIPTTVVFVNGKEVDRRIGLQSESQLQGWLDPYV